MTRKSTTLTAALAMALIAVAAGMFSAGAFAGGGGGSGKKVLGKGAESVKPDCGDKPNSFCTAIGSVTGFLTSLEGKRKPMVAPSDGRIVAWSVELGEKPSNQPTSDGEKSNLEFFQDLFGNDRYGKGPVARVAILKRQEDSVRYKLKAQGPPVKLSGQFYDRDTVITLDQPLPIKKGEIVGLTSLTWIPTLRSQERGGGDDTAWRASRGREKCGNDDATSTKPHKKVGSERVYGCEFDARIFYKAYFVPN